MFCFKDPPSPAWLYNMLRNLLVTASFLDLYRSEPLSSKFVLHVNTRILMFGISSGFGHHSALLACSPCTHNAATMEPYTRIAP